MNKFFIYLLIISCLTACSSEHIEILDQYDESYFPLQKGKYVIYQVEHTEYDLNGVAIDSYQLKESIVDSFPSLSGTYVYILNREIWNESTNEWELHETWNARLENNEAVITEGNVQYLKLKLPLIEDKTWDGNAYSVEDEDIYMADSLGFNFSSNESGVIEHTITVIQNDNFDKIVETDFRVEKYAPNIGLIYKEITNLEYCTSTDECLGQQIIEQGQIYKQSVIAFGSE